MKKILFLFVCCVMLFPFTACSRSEIGGLQDSYEVAVGEVLLLPGAEDLAYSCDAPEAEIAGGMFVAGKSGEYEVTAEKGKVKKTFVVRVLKNVAPTIRVAEFEYAEPGNVTVPAPVCYDAEGKEVGWTASVSYDGTEIPVSNGSFMAEKTGNYTVTYVATDEAGNTSEKQSLVFVKEESNEADVFMPFETEWGAGQLFRNYNFKNSYSEEICWGNEAGSTKLTFTADRDPWIGVVFTRNALVHDISGYSVMVFHIYNDCEYDLYFTPNWVTNKGYRLTAKQWNTVEIGVDLLKDASVNKHIHEYWEPNAADALAIIFADYTNLMARFDVYFGNIYLK